MPKDLVRLNRCAMSSKSLKLQPSATSMKETRLSLIKRSYNTSTKIQRNDSTLSSSNLTVFKKIIQSFKRSHAKSNKMSQTCKLTMASWRLKEESQLMIQRMQEKNGFRKRRLGKLKEQTWIRSCKIFLYTTRRSKMNASRKSWSSKTSIKTTRTKWSKQMSRLPNLPRELPATRWKQRCSTIVALHQRISLLTRFLRVHKALRNLSSNKMHSRTKWWMLNRGNTVLSNPTMKNMTKGNDDWRTKASRIAIQKISVLILHL